MNIHWKCLNLVKSDGFVTYVRVVNREYEKFKLRELTLEIFKFLILVQGLIASKDADIRVQILMKLEQDQNFILQTVELSETYLQYDTNKIKKKDYSHIFACQVVTD